MEKYINTANVLGLVGTAFVTAGIAAAEAYVVVKAFEEGATMGIAAVAGVAAANVVAGGVVKMVSNDHYEKDVLAAAAAMTSSML